MIVTYNSFSTEPGATDTCPSARCTPHPQVHLPPTPRLRPPSKDVARVQLFFPFSASRCIFSGDLLLLDVCREQCYANLCNKSYIYITYNYIIHIYIYVHDITLGMIYAYIHSYIRYVRTYVHYFIGDYHYL